MRHEYNSKLKPYRGELGIESYEAWQIEDFVWVSFVIAPGKLCLGKHHLGKLCDVWVSFVIATGKLCLGKQHLGKLCDSPR